MQISDAASQYNQNIISNAGAAVKNQGVEQTVSNVRNLQPGHIFEGTVNGIKNGVVSIGLSTGDTLSARLDAGVTIAKGDSVFFQVKSNQDNLIQIRALTGQLGSNPTLEKALNAASLPINPVTLNMVNTMMKEQMSIDSASLNLMSRNLAANQNADVSTIVQMAKLGINMTPENISQFENYKADKSAILLELNDVMEQLPSALTASNLSSGEAVALNRELVSILTEGLPGADQANFTFATEAEALAMAENEIANVGVATDVAQNGVLGAVDSELAAAEMALFEEADTSTLEAAKQAEAELAGETANLNVNSQEGVENSEISTNPVARFFGNVASGDTDSRLVALEQKYASTEFSPNSLGSVLNAKELLSLSNSLMDIEGMKGKLSGMIKPDGTLDPEVNTASLLRSVASALDNGASKEALMKLFSNDGYAKIQKNLMEQQWLMKPEEVAEGSDKIKELYSHLESQMHQIESALTKANIPHENFSAAAQDISNNIDFMNQLNQAYTYVQLPLKMSGQNANGDLYVYTNKKALSDPDAEVSAFLHFDMDSLGPTDVSVKMLHKNVTTHFYLANDEALDLVANNIHLLDNRLKAKGYTSNITASGDEASPQQDFVHDFLMKDERKVGTVHRYSFDVRA